MAEPHNLPTDAELLPMVQQMLEQLASGPVGTKVSGAYVDEQAVRRIVEEKQLPQGGVFIFMSTDPRMIRESVLESARRIEKGIDNVRAQRFSSEDGNRG